MVISQHGTIIIYQRCTYIINWLCFSWWCCVQTQRLTGHLWRDTG